MSLIVYKKNDQVVELPKLRDGLDETQYKLAAAVTGTLYDKAGVAVTGFTDITFTLVPGSTDGTYRGQITEAFDPATGKNYKLKIDASQSGDDFHAEYDVEVKVRTS